MIDERLAELRRLPGVSDMLLLDADATPVSGEGRALSERDAQIAIAAAVRRLLGFGGHAAANPHAMFARYARAALFAQTYATGTLVVLCAPDISVAKLRFAATLAVGRLANPRPAPSGIPLARAIPIPAPAQSPVARAPLSAPTPAPPAPTPTPQPAPPAPAKRKTKLGIWD